MPQKRKHNKRTYVVGNRELTWNQLIDYVINEIEKVIEGISSSNWTPAYLIGFITQLVQVITRLSGEIGGLGSFEQRQLATDVTIWAVYDKLDLNVPYVPDFIEKRIIRRVLRDWVFEALFEWAGWGEKRKAEMTVKTVKPTNSTT